MKSCPDNLQAGVSAANLSIIPDCRVPQRVPYNPGDYGSGRSSGVHAPRHGYDSQGSDYGQTPLYDAPQSRPGGFPGDRHG